MVEHRRGDIPVSMRICSIVLDIRVGLCSSYPRFPGSESFERGPEVAAKLRRRKAFGPTGFASYREPGDRWKGERDQGETRGEDTGLRQGRPLRGCALALVALGVLFAASPALAAKKYVPVTQFPPPYPENLEWSPTGFENLLAQGIAVSDKNDHIYVADSGRGVVFDLQLDRRQGRGSLGRQHHPDRVIRRLACLGGRRQRDGRRLRRGPHHGVIDKFDEGGNLITSFGDSEPTHNGQLAGLGTPAGSFAPPTDYYSSFAIAINQATHDLYVVDAGHKVIDIFDESGAYLEQITATPAGLYEEVSGSTRTTGIAVTTAGDVYVADWAAHEIFQFNAAGEYVSAWNGGTLPNGAASKTPEVISALNMSRSRSGRRLHRQRFVNNPSNASIDVFDKNGNYLYKTSHAELGGEWIYFPQVIALDQATGDLYSARFSSSVQVFKPIIVPDVSAGAASDVGTTTATLGHVDPASAEGGGPVTECHSNTGDIRRATNSGIESSRGRRVFHALRPARLPTPTDVSATCRGLTPGTEPGRPSPATPRARTARWRTSQRSVGTTSRPGADRRGRDRPTRRTAGRGDRRIHRRRQWPTQATIESISSPPPAPSSRAFGAESAVPGWTSARAAVRRARADRTRAG